MEGSRGPRYLWTLAWDELGLGRMASNLPRNIQHNNPHLPRRANISTIENPDLALDKNASSLPWAIGPRDNSRLLCFPLRPRSTCDRRPYRSSCRTRLACQADPKHSPTQRNLKVSWKILVPLGFSVPALFFFFFNRALIPIAAGTMIVGGFMVLGYERLLSRWARRGFSDLQKLGLITGALGFFALFLDFILNLFLGRLGTSVLGVIFIVCLLWIREDHPATPSETALCSTWV